MAEKACRIFQIKVRLQYIDPPIWRRIQVKEDATLTHLHRVLQIVMGWEDYHLHEFIIGGKRYCPHGPSDDLYNEPPIDGRRVRLNRVIEGIGSTFSYVYDPGDNWQHELLFEDILPAESSIEYPVCLAGERSGPPEDVGGTSGYADYLEVLADAQHEDYDASLQWRGPFDSEHFSLDNINRVLRATFRRKSRSPSD